MNDAHAHPHRNGFFVTGFAVCLDDGVAAVVVDLPVAERIAELLRRHGLADIPDTPPAVWPPPDLRTWDNNQPPLKKENHDHH